MQVVVFANFIAKTHSMYVCGFVEVEFVRPCAFVDDKIVKLLIFLIVV